MADTLTLMKGEGALASLIQTDVQEASAFFSAAEQIPTAGGVQRLKTLRITGNAGLVAEGGAKPVLKTEAVEVQLPELKAAFVTTFTEEMVADTPGFVEAFRKAAVTKLVRDIDGYIAGTIETPAGIDLQSFADTAITQVELGDDVYADYRSAQQAVLGQGHFPSDVVTSPATFGAVSMATPPVGLPVLGSDSWYGADVHTTRALTDGAVLGDFDQAVYGVIGAGVDIRFATTGSVPMPDGTEANLLVENKIAAVVEMRFVWGLRDETAFVRLTDAV